MRPRARAAARPSLVPMTDELADELCQGGEDVEDEPAVVVSRFSCSEVPFSQAPSMGMAAQRLRAPER